jgi:hypothetical protein
VIAPALAIATLTIAVNLVIDNLPGKRRRRKGRSLMGAVVQVDHLTVTARGADGRIVPIVDDVSFRIEPGEVLALIGESGSGKTTIALALMGHARRGCRIASGSVMIGDADVLALSAAGTARPARARRRLHRAERRRVVQSVADDHGPGRRDDADPRVMPRARPSRRPCSCSASSRCPIRRRSAAAIRTRCRAASCSG